MHENRHSLKKYASTKHLSIDNFRDPQFLNLRSLQNAQGRSRAGLYLIEGVRHVARAVEHRVPIESVFFAPSVLSNKFGRKLVERIRQSGTSCLQLSHPLYRELTLAAEPQGIGAVVRQHWTPIDSAMPVHDSMWLAVESIDAPGNLGTIIRTAEATGISGIFILNSSIDPWDPAVVRATMGSLFAQKLVQCSTREFIDWARRYDVAILGSSPAGLMDYKALRCNWPAVLLIGSEKLGLSDQLAEAADFMLRIPMLGRGDSINAAVAAGVLLYEMFNQRRGA